MNRVEMLNWYEKRYFYELDVRDKVEARIRTPAALLPLMFGLIAYFVKNYYFGSYEFDQWSVRIFIGLSCSCFIWSLYYFSKVIYGYNYQLIQTPDEIEAYIHKIRNSYEAVSAANSKKWTEEAFRDFLFNAYVAYTTQNTRNNDKKAYYLNYCIGAVISSFIAISAAFILFWLKLALGDVL